MRRAGITSRFGVRGRLLLAFLAICMFSLIGAASGIFSLSQVGRHFSHITEVRVPQALSWLDLSRQAETVVRAAPALLAVKTEEARVKVWSDVRTQVETLNGHLANIGRHATGGPTVTEANLPSLVAQLNENLAGLNDLVKRRLAVGDRKAALARQLVQVNTVALRLIMPGERILKAQVAEWNRERSQPENCRWIA